MKQLPAVVTPTALLKFSLIVVLEQLLSLDHLVQQVFVLLTSPWSQLNKIILNFKNKITLINSWKVLYVTSHKTQCNVI